MLFHYLCTDGIWRQRCPRHIAQRGALAPKWRPELGGKPLRVSLYIGQQWVVVPAWEEMSTDRRSCPVCVWQGYSGAKEEPMAEVNQ